MTGDQWHSVFGVVLLVVIIAMTALAICAFDLERRPATKRHRRRK